MEEKVLIKFRNIVKEFDGTIVLKGINLDIYENEFVTLLGPSGCGKTTLLRILGGFLEADEGVVIFDDEDIKELPPYKRELNTVFQKYALFPHMNVYDNIAFGLKIKKMSKDVIDQKVMRMLKLIGLEGFENKNVTTLSGGQQQRIAIARALVNEPKVLLLDEPLGALDLKLRKEMQYELKRIQQEVGITFIYVTHDQEEALTMSDKIVIMKSGEIQQVGTPQEIYNEPVNKYVANFIGESNVISGVMIEYYKVKFDDQIFDCVDFGFKPNEKVAFVGDDKATEAFFKIIMGEDEDYEGEFKWGVTTSQSYFPKDNSKYFNDCELSLVDWLRQFTDGTVYEQDLRGWLGRVLFSGEEALKKANVLSGGEKVRCMLAKMMMEDANVLIFDEPTNHLDLESIQALNQGLIQFKENILFTCHDHQFVQTIANRIIEFNKDGMIDRLSTYDEYLEYKEELETE